MSASLRVAVVGGGLAGLTVARQLNLKSPAPSVDVEIFEASDRVGGVIQTSNGAGYVREHAANGVLGNARGGVADLAGDLGIEMVPASSAAKKRWIYYGGRLREVPAGPMSLARTDLLSARGKMRLLTEPARRSLGGEPSVAEFFRHRLGDEIHNRVVAPFVSGIYAGDTAELSMSAAFPRVSELATRGLFRGMLSAQLGARKRGGGGGGSRVTSAPVGGMNEIVDRLADKLAGRIRVGEPVARFERSHRGVDIVTGAGKVEHFDAVVCAVPAYAAAPMFLDADAELAELLAAIPTAPVAVVHLGYAKDSLEHPLDGFGFLAAPSEGLDVLGIVFESSIWANRAPDGGALLRVMIGGRRRPELVSKQPSEIAAIARDACESILGAHGQPESENVVRWPRAIAQYTIGHRERLERAETLASGIGVVLAGASYHGVAVNSVTTDAARAARRVHQLLAAPLIFALFVLFSVACSSAGKTKAATGSGDGGSDARSANDRTAVDAQARETAPNTAFESGYSITTVSDGRAASLELSVIAPAPPARLVASRGLNACGQPRRAALSVHTLGGVPNAVVWVEGIRSGRADTTDRTSVRAVLRGCQVEPLVTVVGRLDASLEVVTLSERAHELGVFLGHRKDAERIATLPMSPVGRGFRLPLNQAGVIRVGGDGVDDGWAIVAGTPYIARSGEKGVARIDRVTAGSYVIKVWHPVVAEPISVPWFAEAGKRTALTVDLSDKLGQ